MFRKLAIIWEEIYVVHNFIVKNYDFYLSNTAFSINVLLTCFVKTGSVKRQICAKKTLLHCVSTNVHTTLFLNINQFKKILILNSTQPDVAGIGADTCNVRINLYKNLLNL